VHEEHCAYIDTENTFEFIGAFESRASLEGLQCIDKEPFGRNVALFTAEQVMDMQRSGQLTQAASHVALYAQEHGWFVEPGATTEENVGACPQQAA
jgi:hypothetical protein